MILRPIYALGASAALGALALTISGSRFASASARLDATTERRETMARDAREILALRSQQARVELREAPRQDVIAQVNAVLAAAKLPAARFKDLERDADAALGEASGSAGPRTRRQSLRLALEGMTVRELGAFLLEWRRFEPAWTVGQIDLAHSTTPVAPFDRYTVRLQITATYLVEAAAGASR